MSGALPGPTLKLRSPLHVHEHDPAGVLLAGASEAAATLSEALERAATARRVLIEGPRGAGHQWIGQSLHRRGGRRPGTFQALPCERADALERVLTASPDGTLLLRRLDRLRSNEQVTLTQALDLERPWPRLLGTLESEGGSAPRGDLDPDLAYEFGVQVISLPSLSERSEDLPAIAEAIVERAALDLGRDRLELAPSAVERIRELPWSGEVEELEMTLRMSALRLEGDCIEAADLQADTPEPALGRTLASVERAHVEAVLAAVGNNRARAARELGINRSTLYNKLREWGLT